MTQRCIYCKRIMTDKPKKTILSTNMYIKAPVCNYCGGEYDLVVIDDDIKSKDHIKLKKKKKVKLYQ